MSLDWIRLWFSLAELAALQRLLTVSFGGFGWSESRPLLFCPRSLEDANGIRIPFNPEPGHEKCGAEIQGGPLSTCPADKQMAVLRDLSQLTDARASRLDIALDYRPCTVPLLDLIDGACAAGHLRRVRSSEPVLKRDAGGNVTGRTIYLGSRKQSPCFVRVYDKGLQTGEADAGEWIRWEAQFNGDTADRVRRSLLSSSDWVRDAFAFALGVVDFRKGSERLRWFSDLCDGVNPVRCPGRDRTTNLSKWAGWFQHTVAPKLGAMCAQANLDASQVLEVLGIHLTPNQTTLESSEVREFRDFLREMGYFDDQNQVG